MSGDLIGDCRDVTMTLNVCHYKDLEWLFKFRPRLVPDNKREGSCNQAWHHPNDNCC